ncbi:MAG: GerMN domain-containing protein [Clostridiales bacterium]|nr:GerMN domain-containing protein [Clostridiales bacterium]
MKGARRWALLILCAALLSGCGAPPPQEEEKPQPVEETALISADTGGLPASGFTAVLYFRYGTTAYLAPQTRQVEVGRNEAPEHALVQALLDGPSGAAPILGGLFPPGTEVLSTLSQGDTLFVTFNEAMMGRYADEGQDAADRTEGVLRRQMCLDALSATLTEAGLCARVQVLVYRGVDQGKSLRLTAGFLDQSGDEALLPPLTRREDRLLTPHNTAVLILDAWQRQEWAALYDLTARDAARPREQAACDAFADGGTLVSFSVSPGSVSPDGQSAVVSVDLTLLGEAGDREIGGYPLRMRREDGLWKIGYDELEKLMNQD